MAIKLRLRRHRLLLVILLVLAAALILGLILRSGKRETATQDTSPLTLVIDPGHGGVDSGAVGADGTKESDLNLKLALVLGDLFRSVGYKAVQTRNGEGSTAEGTFDKSADMEARRDVIRRVSPDAVISIHMNKYEDSSRRGVQVFYSTEASLSLATALQKHLNLTMNEPTLGRGFDPIRGEYYIAENGAIPSVIVECAFLSSPIDEALITDADYRLRLASEIESAVARYLAAEPAADPSEAS